MNLQVQVTGRKTGGGNKPSAWLRFSDPAWGLVVLVAIQALLVGAAFDSPALCAAAVALLVSSKSVLRFRGQGLPAAKREDTGDARRRVYAAYGGTAGVTIAAIGVAACTVGLRFQFAPSLSGWEAVWDALAHAALAGQAVVVALTLQGRVVLLPLIAITMLSVTLSRNATVLVSQTVLGFLSAILLTLANWIVTAPVKPAARLPDRSPRQAAVNSAELSYYAGGILAMVLASTLVLTVVLSDMTTGLLAWFEEHYHAASIEAISNDKLGSVGTGEYVSRANLSSIWTHQRDDPRGIALRVVSEYAPGYLRSRVFDSYRGGEWFAASVTDRTGGPIRQLPLVPPGEMPASVQVQAKLYRLRESQWSHAAQATAAEREQMVSLEIHNDSRRGRHFFLSVDTAIVEGDGSGLRANHHDVLLRGLDPGKPYVAHVVRQVAAMPLSANERQIYLTPPDGSQVIAREIAEQIFRPGDDPRQRAAAVERFFQSHFSYSLDGVTRPPGKDPVDYFLRSRHPAHCEYFASAAIAILRAGGVPCRYVSGYTVEEFNDETDRWLARNQHAHAWVEAYDDTTGRWFVVEPTSGRRYLDRRFGDYENLASTQVDSGLEDELGGAGGIQQLWQSFVIALKKTDVDWLARMVRIPLLVIIAVGLALRFRTADRELDRLSQQYRSRLRAVDRRAKKLGFIRGSSETLHQFAERMAAEITTQDAARGSAVIAWYRRAAEHRYRGWPPPAWKG